MVKKYRDRSIATSGIYGVLSYSVVQRTIEIGIRMAISAPRIQVLRMILADGFAWILPGLLAGFLMCLVVTPLLAHFLCGVQATNLANYAVMLMGSLRSLRLPLSFSHVAQ